MPKRAPKLNKTDNKKAIAREGGNRKRPGVGGSNAVGGTADKAKMPTGIAKSAGELGIKAESMGIRRGKAKTHKGRKILEAKEA